MFIARDNSAEARQLVGRLADGVDRATAVVIFPEGRLFRDEVRQRALVRLAATNPERFARLSGIRHVLPTRSYHLVQDSIDAALAERRAATSSYHLVQDSIDAALAERRAATAISSQLVYGPAPCAAASRP